MSTFPAEAPVTRTCPNCQNTFVTTYMDKRYCNIKCRDSWQKKRQRAVANGRGLSAPLQTTDIAGALKASEGGATPHPELLKFMEKFKLEHGRIPKPWEIPGEILDTASAEKATISEGEKTLRELGIGSQKPE